MPLRTVWMLFLFLIFHTNSTSHPHYYPELPSHDSAEYRPAQFRAELQSHDFAEYRPAQFRAELHGHVFGVFAWLNQAFQALQPRIRPLIVAGISISGYAQGRAAMDGTLDRGGGAST